MSSTYRLIADRIGDLSFISVEPELESSAGLVVCMHGLRAHKERMLETCYRFARRGFQAVTFDLAFHGELNTDGILDKRLEAAYVQTMFGIIEKSVGAVTALLDRYGAERAGVHGLSMGGIVAFAAMLADPRLVSASVVMGSPDWVGMLEMMGVPPNHPELPRVTAASPLTNAAHLAPRPILMLHGDLDETVPIDGVIRLNEKLTPLYRDFPERLDLVVYKGVGHTYLDDMIDRSIDWASRHLAPAGVLR